MSGLFYLKTETFPKCLVLVDVAPGEGKCKVCSVVRTSLNASEIFSSALRSMQEMVKKTGFYFYSSTVSRSTLSTSAGRCSEVHRQRDSENTW